MRAIRLKETRVPGVYRGDDRRLYEQVTGTEARCCRCARRAQAMFKRGTENVCGRHVRVSDRTKTRIRMTTTFAWRVLRSEAGEVPAGTVVRRGDERSVAGAPERFGRFDKFEVPGGGHVLVPRSRWAWADDLGRRPGGGDE